MNRQKTIEEQKLKFRVMLSNIRIDDEELKTLVQGGKTELIQQLWLDSNRISHKGVQCLASGGWNSLRKLYLSSRPGLNEVGDKGCRFLCQASMPNLEIITLGCNRISGVGLDHLSKHKFSGLKWLGVGSNEIGGNIIRKIVHMNCELEGLSLDSCGLEALQVKAILISEWPLKEGLHLQDNEIGYYEDWLRRSWQQRYGQLMIYI